MNFVTFLLFASFILGASHSSASDELTRAMAFYEKVQVPSLESLEKQESCARLLGDVDALFWEVEHYMKADIDPLELVRRQYDKNNKTRPDYEAWWVAFHRQFHDAEEFFQKVGSRPRRYFTSSKASGENSQPEVNAPRRGVSENVKPWRDYPTSLETFARAHVAQFPGSHLLELWARWVMAGTDFSIQYDYSKPELSKRFRELMFRFHPDRRPGDLKATEAAKAINIAYGILRQSCRDY